MSDRSGSGQSVPTPGPEGRGYTMGWVGAQQRVLAGDLAACADLRDLAAMPHAYAVGPLAALRGEVTVVDGIPLISTVTRDTVSVEDRR